MAATKERARNLADFFGLRRSIVGLLSIVILVGMGERMGERFLPVYIVALGGGAIAVGLLNGLQNLLGALYSFPGGYLADRVGIKRSLLAFNLVAILGFLIVIAVPRWVAVILGAIFFLAWSAVSLPATMSLIARALPKDKRTMGVSMHSLVRRIPMALGPLAGGLFITHWGRVQGVRYAFVAAVVFALIAIALQETLIEDDRKTRRAAHEPGEQVERNPLRVLRGMTASLRMLLISDTLIRFCEQIPYAFVVLWAMQDMPKSMRVPGFHPVNALQFGVLTAIEMITAVLVYIPVAYFADRGGKKPFVVTTFVFFTLFPLVLLYSRSFPALVGAFILRGMKEFGEPTRKALIVDLSPEGKQAQTFGAYYLARDVIVSAAAFGGAFLWRVSPAANFLTAFGFGVIGTVWFAWRGKDVEMRRG